MRDYGGEVSMLIERFGRAYSGEIAHFLGHCRNGGCVQRQGGGSTRWSRREAFPARNPGTRSRSNSEGRPEYSKKLRTSIMKTDLEETHMKPFIIFNGKFRTRSRAIACLMVVSLIAGSTAALAHQGDRIFPFFEITDEVLELIDLHDGNIIEWEELFEPSLTPLDFTIAHDRSRVSFDPSDIDFRVWLGWNDTYNRLYVAVQAADDSYMVRVKINQDQGDWVGLKVDGDHSGGPYRWFSGPNYRDSMGPAQAYIAPSLWDMDRPVGLLYDPDGFEWVNFLPYIDGGKGAVGGNPVFWAVEFFVTPFDAMIWKDQESSVVSELEAGKVIGFFLQVVDLDMNSKSVGFTTNAAFLDHEGNPSESADYFSDGVLLGAEEFLEGSAVQPSSWGLIKASFQH